MQIHEIENLSFSELKARRDELVAEAAKVEPEVLAARYVQARTDAAMRDEKLAEQGKTIGNLNDAADVFRERVDSKDNAIKQHVAELEKAREAHSAEVAAMRSEVTRLGKELQTMRADLASERQRAERLKAEAQRHAEAFSAAQKALADAAALQQIETADVGE